MKGSPLEFRNLSVGYQGHRRRPGTALLENLTGILPPNRLTFLIGENGAGKSTLLKTFTGIIPPLRGEILMMERPLSELSPVEQARLRAFAPGGTEDPGPMTLSEYTALGLTPWPQSQDFHRQIGEILASVGLAGRGRELMNRLSDGEKQKGRIARALAQRTSLIILDEPDAHLDVRARAELWSLLTRLVRDNGKTVLLTTHDISSVNESDSLWIIAGGNLEYYNRGDFSEGEIRSRFKEGFSSSPFRPPR